MTDLPNPEKSAILKKRAEPAEVPDHLEEAQAEATFGWLHKLWNWLKGHTASEARRLKEAAVDKVEGESSKAKKEAKKLDAEAELLYAEAEQKKQEASLKELMRRMEKQQTEADALERKANQAERMADALERLEEAINRLRQKEGDVDLDTNQILKLLEAHGKSRGNQ